MKKSSLIFLFAFLSNFLFAQSDSLTWDARTRYYLVHTPPSYDGNSKVPLIVAMHGGFGSGPQLETQSKLSEKSDSEGFIVVYPDGAKGNFGIRTWNAGGCCGYSMDNNIDDVGFINTLLDSLVQDFNIDTAKIYATGMSNGAFMSYRVACELGHRFAAIAPVAGSMNVPTCAGEKVPVIHFHSVLDGAVPYQGGIGDGPSNHYNPPLDSVFNVWEATNACNDGDTLTNDANFLHVKWSNCSCGNNNQLYLTQDGGHSWHGGKKTVTGDDVSAVVSANDKMWEFFQSVSECSVGVDEASKSNSKMYPNPAQKSQLIFLELGTELPKYIEVYNVLGQKVFSSIPDSNRVRFLLRDSGLYVVKILSASGVYENLELVVK